MYVSFLLLPSSFKLTDAILLGWFATKIFHPNVGANGEICVNTLKKDWKSTYGIGHILITVKCLLIYPNPESALDEEAGKLLLENYSSYCDRAKLITNVHATPRVKPAEFNTPSLPQEDSPVASSSKDSTSTGSSEPLPELSGSPVVSASKVLIPPTATSPSSLSLSTTLSSKTTPMLFTMPVVTRKSASPGPPVSLKASLTSEKEGLNVSGSQKERHPSPSPLGTADANVGNGGKPRMGVGMGMTSAAGVGGTPGNKAIKRSATGSAATGAEKRKKALKRL
jgi:ubiquitin-conjugating enzyme E2 S